MQKLKDNAGFSLVEVMVAMVILGLITVPVLSGMLVAIKAMGASEKIMVSQLAVSSAVEAMMAEGIDEENLTGTAYTLEGHDQVTITVERVREENGTDLPYYNVTVESIANESVRVETVIREGGGGT